MSSAIHELNLALQSRMVLDYWRQRKAVLEGWESEHLVV